MSYVIPPDHFDTFIADELERATNEPTRADECMMNTGAKHHIEGIGLRCCLEDCKSFLFVSPDKEHSILISAEFLKQLGEVASKYLARERQSIIIASPSCQMPEPQPNPPAAENNARNLPRNESATIASVSIVSKAIPLEEETEPVPAAIEMAFDRILEYATRMSREERIAWVKKHNVEVKTQFGIVTFLANPFLDDNQFQVIHHHQE